VRDHGPLFELGTVLVVTFQLKIAQVPDHCTVKGFILKLIEEPIQEMEKKVLLPKGRET